MNSGYALVLLASFLFLFSKILSFLFKKEISLTRFLAALNDFSPNDSLYV